MRKILRVLFHLGLIIFLTILTQIGGVIYILIALLTRRFNVQKWYARTLMFIGFYLLFSLLIVPMISPFFGRVPLPLSGNLKPLNIGTCILNRHYVVPELKDELLTITERMNSQFAETKINYLDANFPFITGFPLLPHLSHNDGKKIDLAFIYTKHGEISYSAPSPIGYGIYEKPLSGEVNYPEKCNDRWQYSLISKFVPQTNSDSFKVDEKKTQTLVRIIAESQLISKIFIEPHLKDRWRLARYNKIRFHGCHAVRHDDHIHLQTK